MAKFCSLYKLKNLDKTLYILRGRGARQPLCGSGVTSLIEVTTRPFACMERIADSRPEPTPRTNTATSRKPYGLAFSTTLFTMIEAAYGVAFFGPLNPTAPAEDHASTLPVKSVRVMMVLLYVAWMYARPVGTDRAAFLLRDRGADFAGFPSAAVSTGVSFFFSSSVIYHES